MIRSYAETRDCPNCESGQRFPLNSRVRHPAWGQGLVVRYEGEDKAVVLFDDVGYKTLPVPLVLDGGLLQPSPGH